MLICSTCKSSESVGAHSFNPRHYSRQIIGVNNTYFLISRMYKCHSYHRKHLHAKSITNTENSDANFLKIQYTFIEYNKDTISLLPNGYGLYFLFKLSKWIRKISTRSHEVFI